LARSLLITLGGHQRHDPVVHVLHIAALPPPAKFAARAEDDVQASPAPIPLVTSIA